MPRMTPLHPLSPEIAEELRDKFRRMLARLDEIRTQQGPSPSIWRPAIDLGELESAILIRVELPGVRPDQIRVSLRDQVLRVEGRKERPTLSEGSASQEDRPVRFLCLERSYGNFALTLSLKWQIEVNGLAARLSDGILEIRLPKASHAGRELVIPIES
jgi:HSP20 family protein